MQNFFRATTCKLLWWDLRLVYFLTQAKRKKHHLISLTRNPHWKSQLWKKGTFISFKWCMRLFFPFLFWICMEIYGIFCAMLTFFLGYSTFGWGINWIFRNVFQNSSEVWNVPFFCSLAFCLQSWKIGSVRFAKCILYVSKISGSSTRIFFFCISDPCILLSSNPVIEADSNNHASLALWTEFPQSYHIY